jgi:hypothetical protein
MYKEGNGTRVIANTLNQMNIPTRLATTHKDKTLSFKNTNSEKQGDTIEWNGATIRQIINNTIYIGQRNFKGEIYNSPVIIDPPLFTECNELMKTKTHRNYLTTYDYLLKDLIRCGVCGNKYYAKYSPDKGYDKVYKCSSTLKSGCSCGNLSINISLLESVIYDQLLKSETLSKNLDNPKDIMKMVKAELKVLDQQLKNNESALLSKQKELNKLLDLYLSNSNIPKEMYETKQALLSAEIESIQSKITLITKEVFAKNLSIANYNETKATNQMIVDAKHNRPELRIIFKQFVDKIIINTLTKKTTLATVFIKLNGVPMLTTLKVFINASGVRAVRHNSNKKYQYIAVTKFSNINFDSKNILITDKDDILNEIESEIRYGTESGGLYGQQYTTVDRTNWLYINETDI